MRNLFFNADGQWMLVTRCELDEIMHTVSDVFGYNWTLYAARHGIDLVAYKSLTAPPLYVFTTAAAPELEA